MDALIQHVEEGRELSSREIDVAAEMLLSEDVSDDKKARFLKGLTKKGETATEVAGFVEERAGKGQKAFIKATFPCIQMTWQRLPIMLPLCLSM